MSKPLRLRLRRDGTLCLVDVEANVNSPDRAFPDEHLFPSTWLLGAGSPYTTVDGDTITVELANARGTFDIVEREATDGHGTVVGISARLATSELFDPPPIDEHRAFEIQLERREREVAAIASEFGVDERTAEAIAVRFGVIPPPPSEWNV